MKTTNCRERRPRRSAKRIMSIILSLVMLFSVTTGMTMTAQAATGSEIVAYARQYIGYPYVYGTQGPNSFDCSGFVQYVFKHFGISLPASSNSYWSNPTAYGTVVGTGSTANAQAGDVISWSGHVAIYTENGKCVEALNSNYGVTESVAVNSHTNGTNYKVIRIYGVTSGSSDKAGPSYDDFHVGEFQDDQFTVMAHVTDPSGISSVRYAVWTDKNDQDDIIWYDGHHTDGNGYYWTHVKFSEHNNEKSVYLIHMYAYDSAGNLTATGITYNFDSTGPSYSDFHVGEFRNGAFTVLAKVTDSNGVSSVRYAIWTENNGGDDLVWYDGHCTDGNDYYWARVNFSEHNNEKGKYIIHMYAYDSSGKLTNPGISYTFPEKGPEVSNVTVSDISETGYTVTCNVSSKIGFMKILFPTWTLKNEQDDLVSDWLTNSKVMGTISGNTVTYRVNTADHNNETGNYVTHIYAYDSIGNSTVVTVPIVYVHNHNQITVTENQKSATCTVNGSYDSVIKCSICNTEFSREIVTISATGHSWNSGLETKSPTCTATGIKTYTCTSCGATKTETIEKIAHTPAAAVKENEKAATCKAKGSYDSVVYCSECHTELSRETKELDLIAHSPATDAAVAPTGTSTGLTEGSHCSVCGEILVAQEVVPALIPEGASVKVNGDKAVITLSDGSTITVPKDTKETVKNADGTYTVTLNDGKSVTVSSNTEITKTADGQLNVKATENGKTTTVTVPSGSSVVKSGDSYVIKVVNGTETVEKTVAAGETVVIDKSGSMSCNGNHKWDKGVVTISATCTSEGVKTYTCSVCGNQKIEKLKKVAHKPVADKAVPATFISAGKSAGTHCSVCGKIIVAQKPVAMLGAAKLSKVKKGKKSFTATWKPVANIDGYEIQYSLKKNMKKAKIKSVASSKKKLKVKKLKAKKKYYVRIRAYKVINGKKQYSAWSAKKKVKTK